jgi:hypothetical protein
MAEGADLGGMYYDPKHGGCLRRVERVRGDAGKSWSILGAYGDDEGGAAGTPWHAHARVVHDRFVTVRFTGKRHLTHEAVYRALWCPERRELHWEDGNVWKKLWWIEAPR